MYLHSNPHPRPRPGRANRTDRSRKNRHCYRRTGAVYEIIYLLIESRPMGDTVFDRNEFSSYFQKKKKLF